MQNASIEVKDEYVKLYNNEETRYFNKEGKEVKNTEVYPNNNLFVKVEQGKYGFADKQGNLVVECKYDKAYEFNKYGFAAVEKDGKWGVLDEQGNEVIAPIFIGPYYRVVYGVGEFYYTNNK